MANGKESLNLWDKIKSSFQEGIKNLTSNNLGESLEAKTLTVKISKQQEELLKKYGTICDAIGSKLIVVKTGDGCILFRLTEENWIEQVDLGNIEFKSKNISRVFKRLFVIEGENKIEAIKFNPDTGERWESLWFFQKYQKGWKDPKDRRISWVTFFTKEGHSQTEYSREHGWDIPNFKLVSDK